MAAAVNGWNRHAERMRTGFHNTVAMINSYFSRLEHLLVLALPCVCWTGSRDSLAAFVGQSWEAKYQRIFNPASNGEAKNFYDCLKQVKERYRNTFAHGGFEKNGASFWIHAPGVGAMPASFSRIRESPTFRLFPVTATEFAPICELFDSVDSWLNHELRWVIAYAESGLDLACDEDYLDRLRQASQDEDKFSALIERLCWECDRHTNMDY